MIGNLMHWIATIFRPVSEWGAVRHYRPEEHYMRGPGPRTRQKSSGEAQ